jgi:hypothetical protein
MVKHEIFEVDLLGQEYSNDKKTFSLFNVVFNNRDKFAYQT